LEDLGLDGRIIKMDVEDGRTWTGLIWLRIRICSGLFECGNEPPGSIKFGEFFD
jgi:hypothetical protein